MSERVKCVDCGRLVAVLREGSHVRKGAVMVCAECRKKYVEDTPVSNFDSDIPGFLRDMFKDE
jgi:DNA-directed RNA polymerase subunit RPC12/RpoP